MVEMKVSIVHDNSLVVKAKPFIKTFFNIYKFFSFKLTKNKFKIKN